MSAGASRAGAFESRRDSIIRAPPSSTPCRGEFTAEGNWKERRFGMYLDFTPEQQALRKQIRDYYTNLFTPELRAAFDKEWDEVGGPVFRHIVGRMGADGWLGIGWPKEFGGQGRSAIEQFIFWDETY